MTKHILRYSLVSSALFVAACTQSPAEINNRGIQGYTPSQYGSPMSRTQSSQGGMSSRTVASAPVGGVVESGDLAPPTIAAPTGISASDLPPPPMPVATPVTPEPIMPAPQAVPLYVDDTVPPLDTPQTSYETNPSQILRAPGEQVSSTTTITTTAPIPVQIPAAPAPVAIPDAPVAAPVAGKFLWPARGNVISPYGKKADGSFNDGINIAATQGEPIVAAADGEVVYSGNELAGYGNMVILRHEDGLMTAYAHADRVLVDKGQEVKRGVAIATVGKSGGVSTPQVHFGVRLNKTPVDPTGYLQ